MTALIIRIRAVAAGEPDRWIIGPSPWAGVPSSPFLSWRCCPDDGPSGIVRDVELHLPRNVGDPAFTVTVEFDAVDMPHLTERHEFGPG